MYGPLLGDMIGQFAEKINFMPVNEYNWDETDVIKMNEKFQAILNRLENII